MQNNGIIFSSYEQQIIQDKAFLLTKRDVMEKTAILLSKFERALDKSYYNSTRLGKALGITFQGPKISKGENFHGLPYQVLDHPRYFSEDGVFSFRSMFWWGHFWSFSLHIQGSLLEKIKERLRPEQLEFSQPVWLGLSGNTWEYDFSDENFGHFLPEAGEEIYKRVQKLPFLKIGSKTDILSPPDELLAFGYRLYEELMPLSGLPEPQE